MPTRTGSILGFLAVSAAIVFSSTGLCKVAKPDVEMVARTMLTAMDSRVGSCSQVDADLGFERLCGPFHGSLRTFKKRWDKKVKRNDELSTVLKPKSDWKVDSRKRCCYRRYELGERSLTVVFVEFKKDAGLIEIQYLPLPTASPNATTSTTTSDIRLSGIGGVSNPKLVSKIDPVYPETARRRLVEGHVILQAIVKRDGTVGDIEVLRAIPSGLGFIESAIEAASQWRYEPALLDGEPIDVYFTIFVNFTLH